MKVMFKSASGLLADEFKCNCSVRNRFSSLEELHDHQKTCKDQDSGCKVDEPEPPSFDEAAANFDNGYDLMFGPSIRSSCSGCGCIAKISKLKSHIRVCPYQPEKYINNRFEANGILVRKLLIDNRPFFCSRKNKIQCTAKDDTNQISIKVNCDSSSIITFKLTIWCKSFKFTIKGDSTRRSRFLIPHNLIDQESFVYNIKYIREKKVSIL